MKKENVFLDLKGATTDYPFNDYYRGRNGGVAGLIAGYLGIPFLSDELRSARDLRSSYLVPPKTREIAGIKKQGVESSADFYGHAAEYLEHADKSVFHTLISRSNPGFYSEAFARSVQPFVLPGVSIFDVQDIEKGYEKMAAGDYDVRLKLANESNGLGQFVMKNRSQAKEIGNQLDSELLRKKGAVLEPNLLNPHTISVGYGIYGKDQYSFIALQKNGEIDSEGRSRYMGATVRVVRGDLRNLSKVTKNQEENLAIRSCTSFRDRYESFDSISSRLSFDYLFGEDKLGKTHSGVTDITARLGGTCPALILSAQDLKDNPQKTFSESEVSLYYDPSHEDYSREAGSVKFIDMSSLLLTAKLKEENI